MTNAEIKKMVDAYFSKTLADYQDDAEDARADRIVDGEGLSLHLHDLEEALADGDHVRVAASVAESILECAGLPALDKAGHAWRLLCRETLRGIIAGTRLQLRGLQGGEPPGGEGTSVEGTAVASTGDLARSAGESGSLRSAVEGTPRVAEGRRLLSELVGEFVHERAGSGRWRDRSKAEAVSALNLFVRITGDRPGAELARRDISAYRDALQRWPLHAEKKAQYRGKGVEEILRLATGGPSGPGETISPTTINQHVGYVQSFVRWAVSSGHIEINIAEGLKLKKAKKASEEREAYSTEDLLKLVRSPLAGFREKSPERFWVPLLGLFGGARLNEICQLHLEDVREVEGVLCIDINAEGEKRLKNVGSSRTIPVHPILIELGFMNFVEGLRKVGKKRVFENLKKGRNGFGHSFSRFWGRFAREHVTTNPLRVFHSFRSGFVTSLLNAGVDAAVVSALVGHASSGETAGRYMKGYEPRILLTAISQLSYGKEVEGELKNLPRPRP